MPQQSDWPMSKQHGSIVESLLILLTRHAAERIAERIRPLPKLKVDPFVRLVKIKDMSRGQSAQWCLRIEGGYLLGGLRACADGKEFHVATALDEASFRKSQRTGRFVPLIARLFKMKTLVVPER